MREVLLKVSLDVVFLQETKLEVWSVWDSRGKDLVFLPSCGSSGGTLIEWDSGFAKSTTSFDKEHHLF